MKFLTPIILKVFGAIISFFVTYIIARDFTIETAGEYFFLLSLIMILSTALQFGAPKVILKEVSRNSVLKIAGYNQWLLNKAIKNVFKAAASVLILMFILNFLYEIKLVYFLVGICSLLSAVTIICSASLQGNDKLNLSIILSSIIFPTIFCSFISLVYIETSLDLIIYYLATSLITALIGLKFTFLGSSDGKYNIDFFSESLPFYLIALCQISSQYMGTIILGISAAPEDVSLYHTSLRVITIISFFLVAANGIFARQYAKLFTLNDMETLQTLVIKVTRLLSLTCIPLIVVICLFSKDIMLIFGTEYSKGSTLLIILCLGQLVNCLTGSVGYLLSMTGHSNVLKNNVVKVTFLYLVLSVLFVPYFGVLAAALLTTFSTVVVNLLNWHCVVKYLKINTIKKVK
ncbi:MAG: O-antigen/teichoic acid export membrane protein [Pseudohongiellaceae bacterium]|jgi:O-antigen/teichoic acid export membrane protein